MLVTSELFLPCLAQFSLMNSSRTKISFPLYDTPVLVISVGPNLATEEVCGFTNKLAFLFCNICHRTNV